MFSANTLGIYKFILHVSIVDVSPEVLGSEASWNSSVALTADLLAMFLVNLLYGGTDSASLPSTWSQIKKDLIFLYHLIKSHIILKMVGKCSEHHN